MAHHPFRDRTRPRFKPYNMLQLQVEAVLASLQQLDEETWHQTYTGILYARDNRKPGTYICIAKKYTFRIYIPGMFQCQKAVLIFYIA